ncbi:MAG: flavin reductase [Oscillospiraceae bacterium]
MDKSAMHKIGYGLYILTAKDGDKDNGCVINTVMQITGSPLIIAIGVNKQNYTHDMIAKTGVFNISVLTTETPFKVFEHFGFQSGKDINKFEACETIVRSENGLLYLPKYINAYISGKVINTVDFNTHTLFISEVTDAKAISKLETLSYEYYQKNVKPKPQPKETAKIGYRCNICGYEYIGDPLPDDFICPICKHGAADFTKM